MRAVFLAVMVFVVGCSKKEGDKNTLTGDPPATKGARDEWTHKEMSAHLTKKGVKAKMLPTVLGTLDGPAVFFVAEKAAFKDDQAVIDAFEQKAPDVVYCRLHKTQQAAKDSSGTKEGSFTTGRFLFAGKGPLFNQIKTAAEQGD